MLGPLTLDGKEVTLNVIESGIGELIQSPDMNAFREWNRTKKSRKLADKRMTEAEAVRRCCVLCWPAAGCVNSVQLVLRLNTILRRVCSGVVWEISG